MLWRSILFHTRIISLWVGGLVRGKVSYSHDWIWVSLDLFWHFIKKIVCSAVYHDHVVVKIVARIWTWVMIICKPTHSLSIFFSSLPPSFSLTIRSPVFSLLFPLSFFWSLFHTHADIIQSVWNRGRGPERYVTKCGSLDILEWGGRGYSTLEMAHPLARTNSSPR